MLITTNFSYFKMALIENISKISLRLLLVVKKKLIIMTEYLPIIYLESHDKKSQRRIMYMNKMNTEKLKLQHFIFMEVCTLLREAVYFLILHLKVLKIKIKIIQQDLKLLSFYRCCNGKTTVWKRRAKEKSTVQSKAC